MWLGFSFLYLGQNIKPYTSHGLGLLENSAKKKFAQVLIDRARHIYTVNPAEHSIPTLDKNIL